MQREHTCPCTSFTKNYRQQDDHLALYLQSVTNEVHLNHSIFSFHFCLPSSCGNDDSPCSVSPKCSRLCPWLKMDAPNVVIDFVECFGTKGRRAQAVPMSKVITAKHARMSASVLFSFMQSQVVWKISLKNFQLTHCSCGRKFNPSALERHVAHQACKQSQRKIFHIRRWDSRGVSADQTPKRRGEASPKVQHL